jgi:D-alanine-D-alanine ligase
MNINDLKNKNIAVLMGGLSKEREISLRSGRAILASLINQGFKAESIDCDEDVAAKLLEKKPDAVIIALHGRYGEDGTVQGMLELMKIPYSGSGVLASAICLDKHLTKNLLKSQGVAMAPSCLVSSIKECREIFKNHEGERLFAPTFPLVVKPNLEGSSLGMSIVHDESALPSAVEEALRFDKHVLIEQFVAGKELTVGLINGRSLPVLELVPSRAFYDFEAKYTKGLTEYIVPARIPQEIAISLQKQSKHIFSVLQMHGVARIDFILSDEQVPVFLEANTIPGMTETSLIPKAAEHVGMSFDHVVLEILSSVGLNK